MSGLNYVIIAGAGIEAVNGIYAVSDSSATGYDRIFLKTDPDYFLFAREINGQMLWCINDNIRLNETPLYTSTASGDSPLNTTGYSTAAGTDPGPTVTEYTPDNISFRDEIENLGIVMYALKLNIKEKLIEKGVTVSDGTKFYQYPDLIKNIQSGGGTGGVIGGEFYKCAEVGTGTWTGYKAVLVTDTETNKQYFDFEETLTTDELTYSAITPQQGKVYTANALVRVDYIYEGDKWLFAEKFDGSLTHSYTQLGEDPVFETIDGRSCMKVDTSHTFSYPSDALPSGNAPRTIMAWIYTVNDSEYSHFAGYGKTEDFPNFSPASSITLYYSNIYGYPGPGQYEISTSAWVHAAIAFDGTTLKLYINGTLQKSGSYAVGTVVGSDYPLVIGYCPFNTNNYTNGYISDLQIYDYELSAEEINAIMTA